VDGNSQFLLLVVLCAAAFLLAVWLFLAVMNLRQRGRARRRRVRNSANVSAWNWVKKRTRVLRIGVRSGD
jgi:hypothetical protein